MDQKFKMNYLNTIYHRYHKSSRKEKREILNEFCKVCKYNRKYAIRILNAPPPDKNSKCTKKREKVYDHKVISILEAIWESSGYLWSSRLKAAFPFWIPWAKKHFNITPEIEQQLLSISTATIDRRLKPKKYRIKKRIYSTTRPGTLLKHMIPIKTHCWDVKKPGFMETDLVAHCGSSAEGVYINSLNCTDIHTTWTETRAIMGKSQIAAHNAIKEIKDSIPFQLLGLDPDNDSPFINWHLKTFCDKHKIQFTRSRPYKKDDNAHIEQKNWTHVRKIFGYVRYDSSLALQAINDLYLNELRLFTNLFQPSVKLVKKIRIGSKLKRIYAKPKTPFQRLCECKAKHIKQEKVKELKKLFHSLDPFLLSKTIDKKLNRIYRLANKRPKSHEDSLNQYSKNAGSFSSNLWLHS